MYGCDGLNGYRHHAPLNPPVVRADHRQRAAGSADHLRFFQASAFIIKTSPCDMKRDVRSCIVTTMLRSPVRLGLAVISPAPVQ